MSICSFPGCDRVTVARQMCSGHYRQWFDGRPQAEIFASRRRPIPHATIAEVSVVQLTQGCVAMIDTGDAPEVSKHNWSAVIDRTRRHPVYAAAKIKNRGVVRLHRFLWWTWRMPETPQVDHIDGDGLNCRRANLRAATNSQNRWNTAPPINNSSGVKGVRFHRRLGKYQSSITHKGERIHLGTFDTVAEAARAREQANYDFHGEFARTA